LGKTACDYETETFTHDFLSLSVFQERLWAALVAGELDMVVSDHSPCTPELKQAKGGKGQFLTAWGGISSLQFGMYIEYQHMISPLAGLENKISHTLQIPSHLAYSIH
jgi:allantoinase